MAVIVISITVGHSLVSSDGFYNGEAPLKMETIEDAGTNLKDCQVGQCIDEHDDDDDDEGDDDEVMAVVLFTELLLVLIEVTRSHLLECASYL